MSSPRCSSCDHRNPACARYCSACGAALALRFEAVFEPERRPWFRRPLVPKDECSPPAGEATVVWRGLEFDAGPSLSRALGMTPRYSIMPVSAEMVRHREHGLEAGPRRKQPSSTAPWPSLDSERTGHPQPIGRPARGPEALRQATRFRASVSAFLLVVVAISAYFVYRPPTYITPTYITQSAGTSLAGQMHPLKPSQATCRARPALRRLALLQTLPDPLTSAPVASPRDSLPLKRPLRRNVAVTLGERESARRKASWKKIGRSRKTPLPQLQKPRKRPGT